MVCFQKIFNGEIIFHSKRIPYWKGCVITNERHDVNYCQVQGWKEFMHVSVMHQTSFWGAQNMMHLNDCVAILLKKEQIESLYFPQKENKLACFANS